MSPVRAGTAGTQTGWAGGAWGGGAGATLSESPPAAAGVLVALPAEVITISLWPDSKTMSI